MLVAARIRIWLEKKWFPMEIDSQTSTNDGGGGTFGRII